MEMVVAVTAWEVKEGIAEVGKESSWEEQQARAAWMAAAVAAVTAAPDSPRPALDAPSQSSTRGAQ